MAPIKNSIITFTARVGISKQDELSLMYCLFILSTSF